MQVTEPHSYDVMWSSLEHSLHPSAMDLAPITFPAEPCTNQANQVKAKAKQKQSKSQSRSQKLNSPAGIL